MSATATLPDGRFDSGAVALWTGAALLAATAHVGAVLWMQRQSPALPADDATAAAIMIELAPEPVAPEAEEDEIAPDTVDIPEVAAPPPDVPPLPEASPLPAPAQAQPPVLPDLPDDPPAPPPPEAMPQPVPAEVAVPVLPDPPPPPVETPVVEAPPEVDPPPEPPVETVQVPSVRPMARPDDLRRPSPPEPPQTVERQPERAQPQPEAPAQPARQARAQTAAPAPTAAAPQTSQGRAGAQAVATWQSRVAAHLERHKRYPPGARQRRQEGTALVRFTIDDRGRVQSARLVRSSGHAELDEAVLALVRRASPLPAPPPGAPHDITAPVQFQIR